MSYSANNNQNAFVQSGRTTSRVLATPGGECSIALGGYTPAELERMRQLREGEKVTEKVAEEKATTPAKENVINLKVEEEPAVQEVKETVVAEEPAKEEEAKAAPEVKKGTSSNAFASSSTTNSFNVLTDRPTSRVIAPPGGASNW